MNVRITAVLIAVAMWSTAVVQTSLTLEQCLDLAHRNSPALRPAEGAIRSSELAKTELSTTGLPRRERGSC